MVDLRERSKWIDVRKVPPRDHHPAPGGSSSLFLETGMVKNTISSSRRREILLTMTFVLISQHDCSRISVAHLGKFLLQWCAPDGNE